MQMMNGRERGQPWQDRKRKDADKSVRACVSGADAFPGTQSQHTSSYKTTRLVC